MTGYTESGVAVTGSYSPRHLTWTIFVPMAVYSIGSGAAAPMYALRALDLGASAGAAGLVVALTGFGMVLADLPAGAVVARIGERGAIGAGSVIGVVGVVAAICAHAMWLFAIGMVLIGVSGAVWGLARQSYLVAVVPPAHRGRALSLMAGSSRFGTFCGPFLGAAPVHFFGPDGALWLQLGATVISAAAMMSIGEPEGGRAVAGGRSLRVVVIENRRALGTLGSGALLTGAARSARLTLLPLWAAHIGVGAVATSLIFGVAGAVDVLMSYPAGVWIDRVGRRGTGVPAMLLFALGYGIVPLTSSAVALGAAAVVLGIANGLSNGLIMTVGADAAPLGRRAEFLGAWRLTHDVGYFVGPIAVGLAGAAALGAAAVTMALASVAGAETMRRWFPGAPAGAAR
ncbi:MFS transporter [Nocardia arizonensis]|uniref:MFS transporter n=1 Tax=Nocardia arizonensis TaxID=1141647 RepID=UPI000A4579CA|nr:MFS transporter [Nocardia arizonensis]